MKTFESVRGRGVEPLHLSVPDPKSRRGVRPRGRTDHELQRGALLPQYDPKHEEHAAKR